MIPASLDRELDSFSEVLGESRSSLIAKALVSYFDILDLDIARERARQLDAGNTKPLTPAEIRKSLRL
jgi:predicted DNA-binding protein